MGALARDVYEVQNPSLCAVMQWRFSVGYQDNRQDAAGPPIHLAFLIAPLVLHPDSARLLLSTRRSSGLRLFAQKFSRASVNKSDVLLALQHRAELFRDVSLRGIQIAVAARLVTVRTESSQLLPLSKTKPRLGRPRARALLRASERLGGWMGELTLQEVAFILRVRF